jgi:hypothetical protein
VWPVRPEAQPDPAPATVPSGRGTADDGGPVDPLDAVRTATAEVARRASFVRLVPDRLGPYARELLAEGAVDPVTPSDDPDDPDGPWLRAGGDAESVAGRVLALDTINFGSGWHPIVRKRLGRSGAVNMANGLSAWLAEDEGVHPERLVRLDSDVAHQVFDQPHDDGPVDELMGLFTVALNDLGRLVCDRYDGSFTALVERAGGSAATLVELLGEMPFFRDVSTYGALEVPLHKRAQLASADLHRAFGGEGLGRFDDLDRLTALASGRRSSPSKNMSASRR